MWLIILLIIIGAFLLVAELILLPGLTVAGIGALISYGAAIYLGYLDYGTKGAFIIAAIVIIVSIAAVVVSLRTKTWERLSLKNKVEGNCNDDPGQKLTIGDTGVTITRMAPIGKVSIDGETYEAKSLGDVYLDPGTEVELVGFENFNIIVRKK